VPAEPYRPQQKKSDSHSTADELSCPKQKVAKSNSRIVLAITFLFLVILMAAILALLSAAPASPKAESEPTDQVRL